MNGWNPIVADITESSVWHLEDQIRLAWVAIIAKKDHRTHKVRMNAWKLGQWARIPETKAAEAIRIFCDPDPQSGSPLEEGRRLKDLGNGEYLVVTGPEYAKQMAGDRNRENTRENMAQRRAAEKASVVNSEAGNGIHEELGRFSEFWRIYPRRDARKKAESAWKAIKAGEVDLILKDVCNRAVSADWTKEGGKYVPYPASYLNARRWEDEAKPVESDGEDWKNSL